MGACCAGQGSAHRLEQGSTHPLSYVCNIHSSMYLHHASCMRDTCSSAVRAMQAARGRRRTPENEPDGWPGPPVRTDIRFRACVCLGVKIGNAMSQSIFDMGKHMEAYKVDQVKWCESNGWLGTVRAQQVKLRLIAEWASVVGYGDVRDHCRMAMSSLQDKIDRMKECAGEPK